MCERAAVCAAALLLCKLTLCQRGDIVHVCPRLVVPASLLSHGIARVRNGTMRRPRTCGSAAAFVTLAESWGPYAANVLDGDDSTFWHTQYIRAGGASGVSPLPHHIDIVMGGQVNSVNGLRYLPRQSGSSNGNCGRYEVRVSTDGAHRGALQLSPAASFALDGTVTMPDMLRDQRARTLHTASCHLLRKYWHFSIDVLCS